MFANMAQLQIQSTRSIKFRLSDLLTSKGTFRLQQQHILTRTPGQCSQVLLDYPFLFANCKPGKMPAQIYNIPVHRSAVTGKTIVSDMFEGMLRLQNCFSNVFLDIEHASGRGYAGCTWRRANWDILPSHLDTH